MGISFSYCESLEYHVFQFESIDLNQDGEACNMDGVEFLDSF